MNTLHWLGAAALLGVLGGVSVACGGDDNVPIPVGGSSGTQSSSGTDVNTGKCDLSGTDPCPKCTNTNCLTAAQACFCPQTGSDTCDAYLSAQVKCEDPAPDGGTPDECVANLDQRFPLGSAASKGLDACQAQSCKTECGF